MQKKDARSRNWLGTFNNPPCQPGEWLESLWKTGKCVYLTGQLEKGAEGTAHIQFFVNFNQAQRTSFCRKWMGEFKDLVHWEVVEVNNGAHTYCMKEETRIAGPWEFGKRPIQRNNKEDWESVRSLAKTGQLDQIPADIYVKHYHTLKAIAKDHLKAVKRTEPRICLWYWGETGLGKSRKANADYPDAYKKMCNKWWDGYQGEKAVIIEDMDRRHEKLGHHLKLWSDPWNSFVGEAKGGALSPNPDVIIVTSNLHIHDIFPNPSDIGPLLRRFEVVHFTSMAQFDT